ncbi:hypothetical protein BDQ17DRAFT_1462229, partial [Cyathus striatus]
SGHTWSADEVGIGGVALAWAELGRDCTGEFRFVLNMSFLFLSANVNAGYRRIQIQMLPKMQRSSPICLATFRQ